jgi:PAS domain-containing protein
LPLILARELASNLATAVFLVDASGMLVFFNDAAERVIGKTFAELGPIDALEWGTALQMHTPDGVPISRRYSPAGIAFTERRPSHQEMLVTGYDGVRHTVQATAYPLVGRHDELHGVMAVFWEDSPTDGPG